CLRCSRDHPTWGVKSRQNVPSNEISLVSQSFPKSATGSFLKCRLYLFSCSLMLTTDHCS
ncbi:hypothetical protein T265_15442, partial [Opisthorchis viverrini]